MTWYGFWDAADALLASSSVETGLMWFYGLCGVVLGVILLKDWWNRPGGMT